MGEKQLTLAYFLILQFSRWYCVSSRELEFSVDDIERHLRDALSSPRYEQDAKTKTISYIKDHFLLVKSTYGDSGNINVKEWEDTVMIEFKGNNWGTSSDKVGMGLGVYTTAAGSPGVNAYGSGMATLLEVSKAVGYSLQDCKLQNSIILAALNMETTTVFVENYVVPFLKGYSISNETFTGAIVMDAVMNYNPIAGVQEVPAEMGTLFPTVVSNINSGGNSGDFIATVGRIAEDSLNGRLKSEWSGIISKNNMEEFKMYDLRMPMVGSPNSIPEISEWLVKFEDFLVGAHSDFWDHSSSYSLSGLKAVFISDTKTLRKNMDECYKKACDDNTFYEDSNNLQMLEILAEAVTRTLIAKAMDISNTESSIGCITKDGSFIPKYAIWILLICIAIQRCLIC